MKKILVIIDSFKGTLTSKQLGKISKEILVQKNHSVNYIPISDGGDGFLSTCKYIFDTETVFLEIKSLEQKIELAKYLIDFNKKTAYIESAKAIGIDLINIKESSLLDRSSFGLGQMILDAINKDCKQIYLGMGGTATNDAGAGLLEALGVKYFDENYNLISKITPSKFDKIRHIDTSALLNYKHIKITLLSDVNNPLLGANGATYIFGPQKGISVANLPLLENQMVHFKNIVTQAKNHDNSNDFGMGAAGGLSFALTNFFDTEIKSGITQILDWMNFTKIINDYDVIISGEGKIDHQTLSGKVIKGIIDHADNKEIILVAGNCILTKEELKQAKINKVYSIIGNKIATLDQSLKDPEKYFRLLIDSIEI